MLNFLTAVVLLVMIGVGVLLIHLLNGQHDERIASFRYGRFPMGARGRGSRPTQPPPGAGDEADRSGGPRLPGSRRDHRDGGRGRSSQRRHLAHGRGLAVGGHK